MKISELIKDPRTVEVTISGAAHTLRPLTAEQEERVQEQWPEPRLNHDIIVNAKSGAAALHKRDVEAKRRQRESRMKSAIIAISAGWTDDDGHTWPVDDVTEGRAWLQRVGDAMLKTLPDRSIAWLWAKYLDVCLLPIGDKELIGDDSNQGN